MLVVQDQCSTVDRRRLGEARPLAQVAKQVAVEPLARAAAGGLDLHQPDSAVVRAKKVRVAGIAEQLVEVDSLDPRGGEDQGNGVDEVLAGAVKQSVPNLVGVLSGLGERCLELVSCLPVRRLELCEASLACRSRGVRSSTGQATGARARRIAPGTYSGRPFCTSQSRTSSHGVLVGTT